MPRIQLTFDGAHLELEAHRITSAIESTVMPNGKKLQALIRFVSPSEMTQLHRFKGCVGPTNVLTFVHASGVDIAICPQVAEEDAMVRGWHLHNELTYLCIHGCLHALGFDHNESASAKGMNSLERQILTKMGLDSHALES